MRKTVGAVLYHCSEAVDWIPSYVLWETQKAETFEDKPGLPVAVRGEIKHIFQNLSYEDL